MLKEKINEDFKAAFKGHEEPRLSVLKTIKAAILNKTKEKEYQAAKLGKDASTAVISDEEIVDIIAAEVKKLKDAIILFEKGARTDLAEANKKEIEILSAYLPEQLNEEEIKKLVAEAVAQTGAQTIKDMGKVMAALMPKTKGKADSGTVGKFVKDSLQ
jgi:uncharacterized protein